MANRTSESVRRIVFLRAFGRCEYVNCSRISARHNDVGAITGPGEFCHILPFADNGPRFEYKQKYPEVQIDSPENVILLCREHHRIVDTEQVEQHPPALLFAMVARKAGYLNEAIADVYDKLPAFFNYAQVAEDVRVGRIFDLINEASILGPRAGRQHLNRANAILRDLIKNPFVPLPEDLVAIITLELIAREVRDSYKQEKWKSSLSRAERALESIKNTAALPAAVLMLMPFVRDEYEIFSPAERLRLIKALLDRLDPVLKSPEESGLRAAAFMVKSGLLRWRGRLQQSVAQNSSYAESERCAERSIEAARTYAALLQLGLVKFAKSRSLPLSAVVQHDEYLSQANEIISSDELDDFPPAVKYRPYYYRVNFELQRSADAFWYAVDAGFEGNMQKEAFVLGECSTSLFSGKLVDPFVVTRALDFLHGAIQNGFDHGRNFMAWISCRACLEPEWFQEDILSKFHVDDIPANPMVILKSESLRYFGTDSFGHDTLFGVDEIEFWNMLGRLCGIAINDPYKAIDFYDVASRYRGRGRFTTDVGRVRALLQISNFDEARRALKRLRSSARAFEAKTLKGLEESYERAMAAATADLVMPPPIV